MYVSRAMVGVASWVWIKQSLTRDALGAVKEGFEENLGLGIESTVAEETVIGREGEDYLSRASDKVSAGLLVLDCTHETENVDQHDSVSELGLVIQTIDFASILRESGKR